MLFIKKTGKTYYVCRKRDCHGAGVIKQGQEFRRTQTHNGHPAFQLQEMKSLFVERLKERAEQENKSQTDIYLIEM
jgi:hypothetical protein